MKSSFGKGGSYRDAFTFASALAHYGQYKRSDANAQGDGREQLSSKILKL